MWLHQLGAAVLGDQQPAPAGDGGELPRKSTAEQRPQRGVQEIAQADRSTREAYWIAAASNEPIEVASR